MREIRIMNVVFLFIFFFLFFSCEDEFVRKNRIIRNFYLNLEFLRIFWRLDDVFVQSLIHKSIKIWNLPLILIRIVEECKLYRIGSVTSNCRNFDSCRDGRKIDICE